MRYSPAGLARDLVANIERQFANMSLGCLGIGGTDFDRQLSLNMITSLSAMALTRSQAAQAKRPRRARVLQRAECQIPFNKLHVPASLSVEIALLAGRSDDQKEVLYSDIRRRLREIDFNSNNSIIFLIENKAVDWSFSQAGSVKSVLRL
jgi:hypothetical protein